MFIGTNDRGFTFFLPDFHGNNLPGKKTDFMSCCPTPMATQGKGVLICPVNPELFGDVFSGFRHRFDPVKLLHPRIHEPPTDGGIVDFRGAAESGLGLGQNKRRA
jgi:hypothetical protein